MKNDPKLRKIRSQTSLNATKKINQGNENKINVVIYVQLKMCIVRFTTEEMCMTINDSI